MNTNYLILSNNQKKSIKVAAISALSSIVVVTAGCNFISEKIYEDYASDKQVETIGKHLNLNLNDLFLFRNGRYGRFIHNNGKPIQIIVKPELQKYMPQITNALDSMIGILHSINPKYSYKFVEKANNSDSVIIFECKDIENPMTLATVDNFKSPYSAANLNDKLLINKASVVVQLDEFEKQDEYMQEYVMAHELAHLLGLKSDVYTLDSIHCRDDHFGKTFINVCIGSSVNMMTPYDIASVLALYTPQAKSKEDLEEKLTFCENYIIEYKTKYYNYYTNRIKELTTIQSSNSITSYSSFNTNEEFIYSYSRSKTDGEKSYACNYEISYKNNKYNIKITDENNNLLDEYSGEIILQNDVMVLKNVTLQNGLTPNNIFEKPPEGYIQDLALVKSNDKIHLFDCYNKDLVNYGTTQYLENELEL